MMGVANWHFVYWPFIDKFFNCSWIDRTDPNCGGKIYVPRISHVAEMTGTLQQNSHARIMHKVVKSVILGLKWSRLQRLSGEGGVQDKVIAEDTGTLQFQVELLLSSSVGI